MIIPLLVVLMTPTHPRALSGAPVHQLIVTLLPVILTTVRTMGRPITLSRIIIIGIPGSLTRVCMPALLIKGMNKERFILLPVPRNKERFILLPVPRNKERFILLPVPRIRERFTLLPVRPPKERLILLPVAMDLVTIPVSPHVTVEMIDMVPHLMAHPLIMFVSVISL